MKWLTALALMMITTSVFAQGNKANTSPGAKWKEECGSCHIAYPARFLSADSWLRMMRSLDKHYGTSAELDAADNRIISEYLKRNAASSSQRTSKSMRITDTAWFRGEHDEISSRAWTDPAIKSPSNCTACHVRADKGDWSEDGVRMPNGLSAEGDEGNDEDEEEDGD